MRFLFDFVFFLFCLFYIPLALIRGKWHDGFWMRMGRVPQEVRARLTGKKNIWVHAVSVGEVMAVAGLVDKLRQAYPNHQIVFSTVTPTGFALAQKKYSKQDVIIFAPLDFSWIVRSLIRLIRPVVYVTAETEIWPNLFMALAEEHIPVVQVNGRISDKAYRQYKAVRFLFRRVLASVNAFGMQSQMYADRIIALGARPENVFVVGNTKFDELPPAAQDAFRKEDLGFSADDELWIAGSTHPGEEEILLDIYRSLKTQFPRLRLVMAPRHVDRSPEISELIQGAGLKSVLFSKVRGQNFSTFPNEILIIDTFGHLRSLYRLAHVVFVGKTLTTSGGQNIIEPGFYGKPIVIGPHMENFQFVVKVFQDAEAVIQVRDRGQLAEAMTRLLQNPSQLQQLGQNARDVVLRNQGATQRSLDLIAKLIPLSK